MYNRKLLDLPPSTKDVAVIGTLVFVFTGILYSNVAIL